MHKNCMCKLSRQTKLYIYKWRPGWGPLKFWLEVFKYGVTPHLSLLNLLVELFFSMAASCDIRNVGSTVDCWIKQKKKLAGDGESTYLNKKTSAVIAGETQQITSQVHCVLHKCSFVKSVLTWQSIIKFKARAGGGIPPKTNVWGWRWAWFFHLETLAPKRVWGCNRNIWRNPSLEQVENII